MKRKIALLLSVCLVLLLLSGCVREGERETLYVATSPDFAPMAFCDMTQKGQAQYVGFDIFLARYIAQELDMELEIMPMSFHICTTAVSMGAADMAISGFSWKAERAENFNLSDFYYAGDNETEQVLLTLEENAGRFQSVSDFDGVTVAAQNASIQMELCAQQLPNALLHPVGDLTTGLLQLKNGEFPCLALAKGQAEVFMANNPGLVKCEFSFEVSPENAGNVVILPKGDDEMTQKVNEILQKAEAAGLYAQWYEAAKQLAGLDE